VYFNESTDAARAAVAEVMGRWSALLARLSPNEQV
jgi:hypothetical protein